MPAEFRRYAYLAMLTAAQTVRRPTVELIMMNDLEVTVKKRFCASLRYYLRIYVEGWRKHENLE